MVVIDGHTHFAGPGKGLPPNTIEDFTEIMDYNGIDAVVTCAPYSSIGKDRTYDEANKFLAEVMKKTNRIIGFVRVNPHLQENALQSIRDCKAQGFRGIKFHPRNEAFAINDEHIVFPIAELAAKLDLPILIHTGEPDTYGFAQPTPVGDLADYFPDLNLIIGHMGKRLYEDAICVARWFDNIILDTSFRSHKNIERAINRVGADRVIYGSDIPFGVPEIELLKIKVANISEEERRMVLGENMANLLDWEAKP
ncbi:amidohydrolase family protein [archaeon]|nr:amidohydrolase family protein [archaeon]